MVQERYYQRVLKSELAKRLQKNKLYSLRAFASNLEISPSILSRILNGQKRLTPELCQKILSKLDLTPSESKKFLYSMALAYDEKGVQRKHPEVRRLLEKSPVKHERDLTPELFQIISDWYHYAILCLMKQKNFRWDYGWMAKQLGIREIEAKHAVERMIALEILAIETGELKRVSSNLNAGDPKVTTSAHKKRIKQITEKSLTSLEQDPVSQRNHTTMTMSIDPDKLPQAKALIDEFMDRMSDLLETEQKQVYELQINLFPLQRNLP